jgi:transcription termination/antitermination protein NusG
LYPGYALVEIEIDDELWHALKSTPGVTGFIGGGTKPVPLTADEVNAVMYRQASSAEHPRPKMTFEKNETVKIIDGPFTNFRGRAEDSIRGVIFARHGYHFRAHDTCRAGLLAS